LPAPPEGTAGTSAAPAQAGRAPRPAACSGRTAGAGRGGRSLLSRRRPAATPAGGRHGAAAAWAASLLPHHRAPSSQAHPSLQLPALASRRHRTAFLPCL
jgi:hypothetical protein